MGSAAARSLARRGEHTVALERFPLGHDRGSSHGPTRIFRLFQPDAGVCLAERAVAAQVLLAAAAGADVRPEVEVVSLRPRERGVAIDTSAGPIEAKAAVVTAGAWATSILPLVPVTATVQTVS